MKSADFLIEEYKHLTDSFLRNEELGERRVNLFLTLTTTVIGALAAINEIFDYEYLEIFFIGLGAVFLFGIFTMVRIIRRNLVTDEYLRALARIRRYFADSDTGNPKILQYLPYKTFDDKPRREKKWKDIFSLGTGGLLENVALVNSLILAAICALAAYLYTGWNFWLAAFGGFIFAWIVQFVYSKRRYDNERPESDDIHFPSPFEIEATLIIKSDDPQAIVKEIAEQRSIKNYQLRPQDTKTIHDLYFDTPNLALQSRNVALRMRSIGSTHLITLKGPSQPIHGGGVKRLEIEEPWTMDALLKVLAELNNKNIEVSSLQEDFDHIQPKEVLANIGFKVVQDRETSRQIRNVFNSNQKNGTILAELAIDSVIYTFGDQKIHHYEVEIEAKMQDSEKDIKIMSEHLIKNCEKALCKWDHSKLGTGKAIEKLLSDGVTGFLDVNSNLKPEAYNKIDSVLKREIHI